MAKYKITSLSWIDLRLVREGEEIDQPDDVVPGQHWQPLDDAAKKAFKAAGYKDVATIEQQLIALDAVGAAPAP